MNWGEGRLYGVILPYACFSITVGDSWRVVSAAPIGKWMVGKPLEEVARWVESKGGEVRLNRLDSSS